MDTRTTQTLLLGGELEVARIGFGAMRLTGPRVWGDPQDREGAITVLREAVAGPHPVLVDTADGYGPHTNELLVRDALHPYGDTCVVATKGGLVRPGPRLRDMVFHGSAPYLTQSAHLSARRLGVDQIFLYYLHHVGTDVPFAEQVETLATLRETGLIRHVGLSNVTAEQLQEARAIVDIAAVTARFNVRDRDGEELLEAAEAAGIAFCPWFPTSIPVLGRGEDPHGAAVVAEIAGRHGATPTQVALAWLLQRSPVMLPIPGTSSRTHLAENRAAADLRLEADEVAALSSLGHRPARQPSEV